MATDPDPTPVADLIAASYALERTGDVSAALQRGEEAVARARASAAPEELAAALVCLAHCRHHLGQFDPARALATEALAAAPPVSRAAADALRILGGCAHENGALDEAAALYHRACDVARQLGYHEALQRCLHSLSACVYIPRGQFELALAADEEALRLALELDMPEVAWFPLLTMGWVYWVRGQRDRALAVVDELRSFAPPGSMAEGYTFCLRGDLAQDGDVPDAALPLYGRARAIAEHIGDPGLQAELRLGLSRYYRLVDNPSAASDWADDALTIAERAGSRDLQAWALIERARAAWANAAVDRAAADLAAAIALLTPMEASYDLARATFFQAALFHETEQPGAAEAWRLAARLIAAGGYAFLLERERGLAFPLLAHHLHGDDPEVATLSAQLLDHLARVSPPPLHIYTLGRFSVRQGTRLIPDQAWRQRRAGELFRLLLVSHDRTALRDRIGEALWPDRPTDAAQSLFHQATSALRRALEPDLPDKFPSRYLAVDGGAVTLHLPEGSWVDFEAFAEHVAQQRWEAALEQYRGDLFLGDLYADWAAARRERLKQEAVQAALAVARMALAADQPDKALSASRRALRLEPWQEEAALLGMQACVARHDRAGAIHLYQQLERALREELAIAPQAAVQSYYRSLVDA